MLKIIAGCWLQQMYHQNYCHFIGHPNTMGYHWKVPTPWSLLTHKKHKLGWHLSLFLAYMHFWHSCFYNYINFKFYMMKKIFFWKQCNYKILFGKQCNFKDEYEFQFQLWLSINIQPPLSKIKHRQHERRRTNPQTLDF